jgi:hypothetical protein
MVVRGDNYCSPKVKYYDFVYRIDPLVLGTVGEIVKIDIGSFVF